MSHSLFSFPGLVFVVEGGKGGGVFFIFFISKQTGNENCGLKILIKSFTCNFTYLSIFPPSFATDSRYSIEIITNKTNWQKITTFKLLNYNIINGFCFITTLHTIVKCYLLLTICHCLEIVGLNLLPVPAYVSK